jgi:hypothetical protein
MTIDTQPEDDAGLTASQRQRRMSPPPRRHGWRGTAVDGGTDAADGGAPPLPGFPAGLGNRTRGVRWRQGRAWCCSEGGRLRRPDSPAAASPKFPPALPPWSSSPPLMLSASLTTFFLSSHLQRYQRLIHRILAAWCWVDPTISCPNDR